MKEHPIIFSGEMVRAILEGRKTQTRRVIKPQPNVDARGIMSWKSWMFADVNAWIETLLEADEDNGACDMPYLPGDQLWVRETFAYILGSEGDFIIYKANPEHNKWAEENEFTRWQSPIYAPRWASRITLEITNVRVEQVQDISDKDCVKEGACVCECFATPGYVNDKKLSLYKPLWDFLNAKRGYGWGENLWVWVIEFKKLGA